MEDGVVLPDAVHGGGVLVPVASPLFRVVEQFAGEADVAYRGIEPDVENLVVVLVGVQLRYVEVFSAYPLVHPFHRHVEAPVLVARYRTGFGLLQVVEYLVLDAVPERALGLDPVSDLVLVLGEVEEEVVGFAKLHVVAAANLALQVLQLFRLHELAAVIALVASRQAAAVGALSLDISIREEALVVLTVCHLLRPLIYQAAAVQLLEHVTCLPPVEIRVRVRE
nr:MAG: hypothetical protein J07AB56_04080 [Candidatus Nanosalinarum sp. J07AB56]